MSNNALQCSYSVMLIFSVALLIITIQWSYVLLFALSSLYCDDSFIWHIDGCKIVKLKKNAFLKLFTFECIILLSMLNMCIFVCA